MPDPKAPHPMSPAVTLLDGGLPLMPFFSSIWWIAQALAGFTFQPEGVPRLRQKPSQHLFLIVILIVLLIETYLWLLLASQLGTLCFTHFGTRLADRNSDSVQLTSKLRDPPWSAVICRRSGYLRLHLATPIKRRITITIKSQTGVDRKAIPHCAARSSHRQWL
jgi:hypothetical protein